MLGSLTWVNNIGPGTIVTVMMVIGAIYAIRGSISGEQKNRIDALEKKVDDLQHELTEAKVWKTRYEELRPYTAQEISVRLEEQLTILVHLSERIVQLLDPEGTSVPRRHSSLRHPPLPRD